MAYLYDRVSHADSQPPIVAELKAIFEALLALLGLGARGGPRVEMRWHPNLHAKVYVFDGARALVTSANLTEDSLFPEAGSGDVEYGVLIKSRKAVRLVVGHLEETWANAEPVSVQELKGFIRLG